MTQETPAPTALSEYTLSCNAVAAMPGASEQLFLKPTESVEIRGLSVSEGFEVAQVWVGKEQLKLEEAIGRTTPPGSFLIAIVVNRTSQPKRCEGAWLVRGGTPPKEAPLTREPAAPAQSAQPSPPTMTSAPTQSTTHQAERLVESNEVVVYLSRELAMRLYKSLYGGPGEAIRDNEKPDLQRRLETALRAGKVNG